MLVGLVRTCKERASVALKTSNAQFVVLATCSFASEYRDIFVSLTCGAHFRFPHVKPRKAPLLAEDEALKRLNERFRAKINSTTINGFV